MTCACLFHPGDTDQEWDDHHDTTNFKCLVDSGDFLLEGHHLTKCMSPKRGAISLPSKISVSTWPSTVGCEGFGFRAFDSGVYGLTFFKVSNERS